MAENHRELTAIGDPRPARRVLVVEDEVMILMMVEDVLAGSGFEPVTATTLDEGMALFKAQDFDAAILDVNLNGVSVSPLAAALAARGLPFAFTTGGSDSHTLGEHGERPVLAKPYRSGELVGLLEALMDRRASHCFADFPNAPQSPRGAQSLPSLS